MFCRRSRMSPLLYLLYIHSSALLKGRFGFYLIAAYSMDSYITLRQVDPATGISDEPSTIRIGSLIGRGPTDIRRDLSRVRIKVLCLSVLISASIWSALLYL